MVMALSESGGATQWKNDLETLLPLKITLYLFILGY